MKEIAVYLESIRWTPRRENGEMVYYSHDEVNIVILGEWWELRNYMECGGEGGYVMESEGTTLFELREALAGVTA